MNTPAGLRQAFDEAQRDGLLLTGRKQMRSEIIANLESAMLAANVDRNFPGLVEAVLIAIRSRP